MGLQDREYIRDRQSSFRSKGQITDAQLAESSFATKVYGWMTLGLAVTAFVAYTMYSSGIYIQMMPYWWVFAIGTFAIAMGMGGLFNKLSFPALAMMFLAYSFLEGAFFGIMLPGYAVAYGGGVIWSAFLTAALVFGIAMVYGIFTRSDLTGIGRILQMALIGLIVITLFSIFIQVTWLQLAISYIGLIIFVGLTAYDAQNIRRMSHQVGSNQSALAMKMSLVMALKMYINVIMIFWYLLQIFGSSNRR